MIIFTLVMFLAKGEYARLITGFETTFTIDTAVVGYVDIKSIVR